MGSVNPDVRVQLPAAATTDTTTATGRPVEDVGVPASGFTGGISSMFNSLGSTVTDAGGFVGLATDDDGSLQAGIDPIGLGGFAAVATGPAALMAIGGRTDAVSGVVAPYSSTFGQTFAANSIRVTPTLISAVLGPAIADGVTMVAPNLVKKYKDTKDIKVADEKKKVEKDNQTAKISRAVAGGLVVGIAAGAVFLLKPELFKKFGAFGEGVDHAIKGSTSFIANGQQTKLTGVLDASAIRATMHSMGRPIADDAVVNILKTVAPMAKDAVFTNRTLVAAAGGVGTLAMANKAAGEEDPDKRKLMWGLTAAAGLATVGGAYGIGKLTQGGINAQGEAVSMLAKNDLLMKPNIEWIKKYATTIAPITAVPAGTAASQYFNIVNDFDEITGSRSPFRR